MEKSHEQLKMKYVNPTNLFAMRSLNKSSNVMYIPITTFCVQGDHNFYRPKSYINITNDPAHNSPGGNFLSHFSEMCIEINDLSVTYIFFIYN